MSLKVKAKFSSFVTALYIPDELLVMRGSDTE